MLYVCEYSCKTAYLNCETGPENRLTILELVSVGLYPLVMFSPKYPNRRSVDGVG